MRLKWAAVTLVASAILCSCGASGHVAPPPSKLDRAAISLCHALDETVTARGPVTQADLASLAHKIERIPGHYFEALTRGVNGTLQHFTVDPHSRNLLIATLRLEQRDCSKAQH